MKRPGRTTTVCVASVLALVELGPHHLDLPKSLSGPIVGTQPATPPDDVPERQDRSDSVRVPLYAETTSGDIQVLKI
jgi:hypothetical protein